MNQILKIFLSATLLLMMRVTEAQDFTRGRDDQEKKIRNLICQMTLQEKMSLLHGNSRFYVSGIKRLGVPEWALSDVPHEVRAEINRYDWGLCGWDK